MSFLMTLAKATLLLILLSIAVIFARRRRFGSGWYRLLLALLCLMFMGNLLVLYPIHLQNFDEEVNGDGSSFVERPGFPVAVVIGKIYGGEDFDSVSWDLSWANLMEQEVCGCSVLELETVNRDTLADLGFIVLTGTACREVTGEEANLFQDWVEEGGVLVLDRPGDSLSSISGIRTGGIWTPTRITDIKDLGMDAEPLLSMPLATRASVLESHSDDCINMMEMDDKVVVLTRKLGGGMVVSCLFDLGMQLTAIQQGVPDDGFRVEDKRGSSGCIDTTDLLLDDSMMDSPVPIADLLERWIMALIEDFRPLPRLWYYQYQHDGLVVMTHDEDWWGDESISVIEKETEQNYTSTFFIITKGPMSPETTRKISDLGADVEVHWNREIQHRWMFIFRRGDGSLEEQIGVLDEKRGGGDTTMCRIERLRWGNHYTHPFRVMEAQGIELDTSYGSAGMTGRGYMSGTGLPYHPIDTNGLTFSLYELPFQIQAQYSGIDSEYIEDLLEKSREDHHEVICALYHPQDLCEGQGARADWICFHGLAEESNHPVVRLSELLEWWRDRSNTEISDYIWENGRVSYSCKTDADGAALLVPNGGLVLVDGEIPPENREVRLEGRDYILIQLVPGLHSVEIIT